MHNGVLLLLGILVTAGMTGCSKGPPGPKTVSVAGTVSIDGKPVEGVEVHFVSEKFASFGKTDAQGKYQLVQGAEPGANKVYFSKLVGGKIKADPASGIDETQLRMMAESAGGPSPDVAKDIIPEDYRSAETTKLKYTVPEAGTTTADFKL